MQGLRQMVQVVRAYGLWIFALLLALGGQSFAQGFGALSFSAADLVSAGKDVGTLALAVAFGVSAIKRPVEAQRKVPMWVWWLLALLLGEGAAFGLHAGGYGASLELFGVTGWAAVALFGGVAAFTASGGRNLIKGLLEGAGTGSAKSASGGAAPSGLEPVPATDLPATLPPVPVLVGGDVTPDADAITQPPSGVEAIPHGLLSLPQSLQDVVAGVLGGAFQQAVPVALAAGVALRLAPLLPELLNGNHYLTAEGRNTILGVVLDAKAGPL